MNEIPVLTTDETRKWIVSHIDPEEYLSKKVLLIVPDATRTAPLPLLFAALFDRLAPVIRQLDVMVALGTHPAMSQDAIRDLLGVSGENRCRRFAEVKFLNHDWKNEDNLKTLGVMTKAETARISGGLLSEEVQVKINARIDDYDTLLILGPVFPHEVVGFSGGNKYFFPGISGPELLHFFHWLGALITNWDIIGMKQTPVRAIIDQAAGMITQKKRCLAFVVNAQAELHGMFYGSPEDAWNAAADLSSQVHLRRVKKPFRTVLSCAPPMYDELWVAGKCMYKLEPVVADGGELIIYAPQMTKISQTHGESIEQIGYHVRDYFTKQWDRFKEIPRGVLAHSTHVRGKGTYENGIESPRIQVTLASGITHELCKKINLGHRHPDEIDMESFANREDESVLLVRKAGETLYRLEDDTNR